MAFSFCVPFKLPSFLTISNQHDLRRKPLTHPARKRHRTSPACVLYTKTENTEESYDPVLVLPGLGNSSYDYNGLAERLLARGHRSVSVAPIERWNWGLNAKGFFTQDYWRSQLKPAVTLQWYFDRVDRAVAEILAESDDKADINILGHSAGGWLGRAYIAERAPENMKVSTLLTLGTPHRGPPEGRIDQTRGLLSYIEQNCDISDTVSDFVCVAGRGTMGKPWGSGSVAEYVAYVSYKAVCGRGDVDGDGVTPIDSACGTNGKLVYCDDCKHSMLTSDTWYGSERTFQDWVGYLT